MGASAASHYTLRGVRPSVNLPPAGKCCKLCGRHRPFAEYVWRDSAGQEGVTARCEKCRNRGKRDKPGIPQLRYPVTRHAAKRYLERCAPHLGEWNGYTAMKVRLEMRQLMAQAEWDYEWPDWLSDRALHGLGIDSPGHLRIDDSTVFILAHAKRNGKRVVVTVLTRDGEQEA